MATQSCTIPSEVEFKLLSNVYGLSLADGVKFPLPNSMILSPPLVKVGVNLKTLDAIMCLPLTDF